jgi:hypothetical protein
MIATLAVETNIPPSELLSMDSRLLWTIERYLVNRSQQAKKKRR